MPLSKVLVDSSFLYAFFDEKNVRHQEAVLINNLYRGQLVVPFVVLTEVAYLCRREAGVPAVLKFMDGIIAAQPQLEAVLFPDLARAREIMAIYKDSRLDFVDCCIMALSERLTISIVCTFDHRDFNIFRPSHVNHLEILP